MPKNQKLSAVDEAILRMEPAAKEMKKRQLANKQAFLKTLREEAEQKRKGTYNPMLDAFLNVIGKEDGGEIKKPGIGFKPMDMGMDIFDAYYGNSKDTTVKGGGTKKGGKKSVKVSPRKAQGMMYGGAVRKKK